MSIFQTNKTEWFWDVFFPSHCLSCQETLQYSKREVFCPVCQMEVFISDTHLTDQHPLKQRLTAGFPFEMVLSKYRFPNKSQHISNMIYGLKYQHLRYIGHQEGQEYGEIISSILQEREISGLIPVPLHWRKQLKRGYNQSMEFTSGLALTTKLPIYDKLIRRKKNTRSQTELNKEQRINNMKNAFKVSHAKYGLDPEQSYHFLLVDDVATSGVTLAEMATTLKATFRNSRMSVCTLAYKDY